MRDDPPQTPIEAVEAGWVWISASCSCRRRGSLKLDDLSIAQGKAPLATLARKMRCQVCRSRAGLRYALGGYFVVDGKPAEHWKVIAFEGDRTVRPPRS